MKVNDVMTRRVATCRPETNLAEAAALMWQNDCGVLPVLTETGELAGLVTDRDMCIALGTKDVQPSHLSVGAILRDHTLVCKSSDSIQTALHTMSEGKVRRLPVVGDNAQLVGILSMDDVVLNAERGTAKVGSVISSAAVVKTLQAIYARDNQPIAEAVAA